MRHPLVLTLLLSASLASGCLGGDEAQGDDFSGRSSGGQDPDGPSRPLGGPVNGSKSIVLRNGLAQPLQKTVWANGTVAAQDTCNTGACVFDTARAFHVTDISNDLPPEAPVQVEIELTYPPSDVTIGGFDVWVESEGTFYAYDYESISGSGVVKATLLPGGSTQVIMAAYGPGLGGAETPYSLRIALQADPRTMPGGVPVGIRLGPGDTLAAVSEQGEPLPFLLFTPQDAGLGLSQGPRTLEAGAPEGEYIVLLPPDSAAAHLVADSGDATMTPLGLRFELSSGEELPPQGEYERKWEATGYPLGVGVRGHATPTDLGPAPLASLGFQVSMTGPNGFRIDSPRFCQLCLTFGGAAWTLGSALGDPRVVAGSYAIHAESTATYSVQVMPFAVYAQRPAQ